MMSNVQFLNKAHRHDGSTGLNNDHLINADDDCLTHIALLSSLIIVHGSAPDTFPRSTIVSISKGKHRVVSDSANLRGITLSSIYGKLFDNIQ